MQSIIMSVFAVGTVLGSGAAVVQHAYSDQTAYRAAETQAEAPQAPLISTTAQSICQPVRFRIYFSKESAQINDAGRELISHAVENVSDCDTVNIMIGAPDPQLDSKSQRQEASERSAALLAALEASGLNGDVYVARETDVLNGPGAYIEPQNAATPDYIVVSIQPADPAASQPLAAGEAPGLKT